VIQVRRLTDEGIRQFADYVDKQRAGDQPELPVHLLNDPDTSAEVSPTISLGDEDFATRFDLGAYLVDVIGDENIQHLAGDAGFWSWLALYWFEQLCPEDADGNLKPAMVYNYVLSSNYKHRYRHAVYTTWQLVNAYGDSSRFLLSRKPSVRGELIEQMMARQYYLSCRGVMEAAAELYWDPEANTFKRGAAARTAPGCVSRLVLWLQQIELTYDIFSMTREQILDLMPGEFDRFKDAV
jgi:hypothetical protein